MKALVTGGAGFIGSNLCDELLRHQWSVRVLDNLSSGAYENIAGMDVEWTQGDVRDPETAERACEGVDAVFHLAASVGRQRSLDDPKTDAETNVIGMVNILQGMLVQGVPKIVYSSSAAIFGELLTPSINENHLQNADSPYGVSKLAAEKMILAYCGIYGITGVCLRYFNIYGVRQRYDAYGNVIPIFANRLLFDQPISIYGDGEQTRDFLNVQDVARANRIAAETLNETDVFNLGCGESITINELADKMQRISGRSVGVEYLPKRPADVLHCRADIQKAAGAFGFSPQTDLDAGLAAYLDWFFAASRER